MNFSKDEITSFFHKLDRSKYMEGDKYAVDIDRPFPIGHGQTISQPSLVLNMTIQLDLEKENKVLEIGTGSGFQTALLAQFAKSVYTVERIEALHSKAKDRLDSEGYNNIQFHLGDGSLGWEKYAPYDRIMVTAAAENVPAPLVDQLASGGKMVIPVGDTFSQELQLIEKDKDDNIQTTFLEYVRFVRLEDDSG